MQNKLTLLILATIVWLVLGSLLTMGYSGHLFIWLSVNVLLAVSFRFVFLIGELNFAIAGFVALGAYAGAVSTVTLHWPFLIALLLGASIAGVVGFIFGAITLRATGAYFMLTSFAFTEVVRMIITKLDIIGGNSGMIGIYPAQFLENHFPLIVAIIVLAILWLLGILERCTWGKILSAIRDSKDVVASVGVRVYLTKCVCLAIGAASAGVAGVLLAHTNNVISPADFSYVLAVLTLTYMKVGGEDHFEGPILGAIIVTLGAQYALQYGAFDQVFYGALIVIIMIFLPKGLRSLLGKRIQFTIRWRNRSTRHD